MAIRFQNEKEASANLMQAMGSGDETAIQAAWQAFHSSVVEQVLADFEEAQASNDTGVLMQRGYRQLTSKETKFYNQLADVMKAPDYQQKFATIAADAMPETIIQDVYKNLKENHPLLSRVNFQHTGYSVKWILNDTSVQKAVWGDVTDAITKEITGGFKIVDVNHAKLSAYAFIERSMLDLGPVFLDGYIRTCLQESLASGFETGIVKGSGLKEPIGLNRDVHEGVSFSTSTGYPVKTTGQGKHTVTDFTPASYGTLAANLFKTETGKTRKMRKVSLLCNTQDYLTKVMPATTVLNANGVYVNDLFPIPTEVITTEALDTGEAILCLLDEYHVFAGGPKDGVIEASDEYKFIEDLRYFKIKQYATAAPFDNTCSLLLDISGLEPGYITVKQLTEASASQESVPEV